MRTATADDRRPSPTMQTASEISRSTFALWSPDRPGVVTPRRGAFRCSASKPRSLRSRRIGAGCPSTTIGSSMTSAGTSASIDAMVSAATVSASARSPSRSTSTGRRLKSSAIGSGTCHAQIGVTRPPSTAAIDAAHASAARESCDPSIPTIQFLLMDPPSLHSGPRQGPNDPKRP